MARTLRSLTAAAGTGGRQFSGIVGASATVITAEDDRPFAGANAARDHRAGAGRAVAAVLGGVNGAKTRRPARIRRLRDLQYPDSSSTAAGSTTSTWPVSIFRPFRAIDRAHRNHPRQQRRGAVRRQRGRRRHQHRPEERRRRPAGCDPRRGRRRIVQPAHGIVSAATNYGPWSTSFYGNGIKSDGYRVNNALDQRNGVGNLNYTTPDLNAFLTVTGDDQKLGFPGGRIVDPSIGVNELVTDRRGAATPFDYGNQQGASATAGFTKTLWNGVELIVDGGVRKKDTQSGFFGTVPFASPLPSFSSTYNDASLQTWSITPRLSVKNSIFGMPSQILTGIDYYDATFHQERGAFKGACRRSTPTICRNRRWPATGSTRWACCRRPISPTAPGFKTPA